MSVPQQKRVLFLVGVLLALVIAQHHDALIDYTTGKIQDLTYYVAMADYFWKHRPGNFYLFNYRVEAFSYVFHRPADFPMPTLWSPLALVVLAPLTLFFPEHVVLGHTLFILISAVAFLSLGYLLPGMAALSLLVLCLPVQDTMETLATGQASILAAGILGLILYHSKARPIVRVLGMLILCTKPTYVFPAVAMTIVRKEWQTLTLFGCSAAAILAGMMYRAGDPYLLQSYLHTLSMFQHQVIDEPFKNNPTIMANFAMVLSTQMEWLTAFWICTVLFFASQLAALWIGLRIGPERGVFLAGLISTGALLTFSPYVGWYEEMLLAPFIAWFVSRVKSQRQVLMCFAGLLIVLSRPVYIDDTERLLIFSVRSVLIAAVLVSSFREARKLSSQKKA